MNKPFFNVQSTYDTYKYGWQPCSSFTCVNYNAAVCQESNGGGFPVVIGAPGTGTFSWDNSKGNVLIYTAENGSRKTTITLVCNLNLVTSKFTPLNETSTAPQYNYNMMLESRYACPQNANGFIYPPAGGVLSVGSILLIVFFLLIILYVCLGVAANILYFKQSNKEVIPQVTFWMLLPGLIKDGALFIVSPCIGSRADYQKV